MRPSRQAWRPRSDATARRDLRWVIGAVLAAFGIASTLELQERLAAFSLRLEAWQADELPLTLVALSLGLAWYAWRRRRDATCLLAHNRELTRQLIALQESERLALARELHDELAQHCTAIRVEATYIQRAKSLEQAGAAARRAGASAELLQDGVRRLLRQLRPAELDELGLAAALQSLSDGWAVRSGVDCAFVHRGPAAAYGEAVDTAVYRVAQEALANVMRHAHASHVNVLLCCTTERVELSVQDDGRGFPAGMPTRGFGLLGATERAAALGGELWAESVPGAGTRIRLCVPLALEGLG